MKKKKETIGFVLRKSNLSDNPDYYSGKTINDGDINADILCTVSKNIKKYIGQKEQKVFNSMVLDIPTLRASFFIELTVKLQIRSRGYGWWWDKEKVLKVYYEDKTIPICKKTELIKEEFKKLMKIK